MRFCALFVCLFVLSACARHDPSDFEIEGLAKSAVLEKLGNPSHQTFVNGRQLNGSMGPKPRLAASMADKDTVEMWQYKVKGSQAAQIFFGDAGNVAEVIIYPTDVMH
jgi:hypothetical protein